MRLNYNGLFVERVAFLLGIVTGTATTEPAASTWEEDNQWPMAVESNFAASGRDPALSSLGPFAFRNVDPVSGVERSGLRPFWVEEVGPGAGERKAYSLYPFLRYESTSAGESWSVFSLVRVTRPPEGRQAAQDLPETTEIWPFYLARKDPARGDDYRAVFPFRGDITNRFGRDRWEFTLFPFYSRTEKGGRIITQTPWPFFRRIEGAGHKGVEVWPFYGHRGREGDYEQQFWLWPLGYSDARRLSEPVPDRRWGFLPFRASSSGPGYRTETYLWPFFGWSERTAPLTYSQKDYLWPLFVQGRGDARYVNRWAPFYTHSRRKGSEKHWVLWPLFRHETIEFSGLQEEDTRLLFFVYRSTEQTRPADPQKRTAKRSHVWPLMSAWSDGNGREQLQMLSPLEPIFPNNEPIRHSYSPLFALYRYNQTAPGTYRHSLLWDLATFQRREARNEWHLGPLLEGRNGPQGRYALLKGLVGIERREGRYWRPFVFKFSRRKADSNAP